jgi:serine/threonine protein kinase
LKDTTTHFAVKEFPNDPQRARAFEREIEMMKILADYTEEHIVMPYTFWSRDEKRFILYPLATTSLRDFLKTRRPPDLEPKNVLWFLGQLNGLATAIAHVHNLKVPPTKTQPKPEEDRMWGSHRDIKPENILVFETSLPVFKIADFGAGEFRAPPVDGLVSHGTDEYVGTTTYMAPDWKRYKRLSRPADMWSLGCVYLELLLWYFEFFTADEVDHFSTRRQEFTGANPDFSTDEYWYKKRSRSKPSEYLLKPVVHKVLQDLKRICHKMRAFEHLIQCVELLLKIEPKARRKAPELVLSLKNITKQARSDLRKQPDSYTRLYYQNRGGSYQNVHLPNEAVDPRLATDPSDRSGSPVGHQRGDSMDMDSPGLSGRAASPTAEVLLSTGTADALQSPDAMVEPLTAVESRTPPSRSTHLEIPRPRSST